MDLQATVEYNLRNCKEKSEGGEERETGANEVSRNKENGDDLLSHRNDSTIGAAGLNFSVRNGKRCTPTL